MALPLSLSAPTSYGHNETIASFASLEEAEEALSSLLSELETASPSRAFSLSTVTEYGHTEELASFASLEEAEEALSSLYDALEEASLSRSYTLQSLISQLEEQLSEARLCAEPEAEEALS